MFFNTYIVFCMCRKILYPKEERYGKQIEKDKQKFNYEMQANSKDYKIKVEQENKRKWKNI